jgi:microcystin-dependent protein
MPIGVDGTYTLASTGGAATTTLVEANLPSHSHTITDPTHFHQAGYTNGSGGSGGSGVPLSNFADTGTSVFNTTAVSTGINGTNNTGSGTAATTISPYLGIYYIIKT